MFFPCWTPCVHPEKNSPTENKETLPMLALGGTWEGPKVPDFLQFSSTGVCVHASAETCMQVRETSQAFLLLTTAQELLTSRTGLPVGSLRQLEAWSQKQRRPLGVCGSMERRVCVSNKRNWHWEGQDNLTTSPRVLVWTSQGAPNCYPQLMKYLLSSAMVTSV